jgi:protein PhnA
MNEIPRCPKCNSDYGYKDNNIDVFICPECGNEWVTDNQETNNILKAHDSNGNLLSNGDTITILKDLKLKGTSSVIKVGTKIKNIYLVEGDHNIDCKVKGVGPIKLKSEFVKKA